MDCQRQVDLIVLDFHKVFDTVLQQRLLKKLNHHGNIHDWLSQWRQRVVVSGYESTFVSFEPGVPQGMVLGPLIFLMYTHEITSDLGFLRPFTDGCIIYQMIECNHDHN